MDVDARPDVPGLQYMATGVKDIQTGVVAVVGSSGTALDELSLANTLVLPPGAVVLAELTGPQFASGPAHLLAAPNQAMSFPRISVPGTYFVGSVRLVDGDGAVVVERDPTLPPIAIEIISQILASSVTSRPLTLEEIQDAGIIIDASSYTAVNFTVGLTFGSEQVVVDLPVVLPAGGDEFAPMTGAQYSNAFQTPNAFETIDIPNLSLSGFQLLPPPEVVEQNIELPPIRGVMIIPGNIAFLNQFFSVLVATTNLGPEDSGLTVMQARARVHLPTGLDGIPGSCEHGDDPLCMARTIEYPSGVPELRPLLDDVGSDAILPQGTNQAEYLVEGLREGTHRLTFDILGDLYVPALETTVPVTGTAAGIVQVKNPTFSVILAHPDVVRAGEEYSMFATVTNTSSSPANKFSLGLNTRSMSGTRVADGGTDRFALDTLAPGEAASFEFRMEALVTGEVTGTVFLADTSVNGAFLLTPGVGDTGIPLSPDTLVLPSTVDYIPDNPDLVFAAVRLLGQAYSVATAPSGSLPAGIDRIRKKYVMERAVKLAQVGLHARFGEGRLQGALDLLLDHFGNGYARIQTAYEAAVAGLDAADPLQAREIAKARAERDAALADVRAFDGLRRRAAAGANLSSVLGEIVTQQLGSMTLAQLQLHAATLFASQAAHLSFGAYGPSEPARLTVRDDSGAVVGIDSTGEAVRTLPFADVLPLGQGNDARGELIVAASLERPSYDLEMTLTPWFAGGEATAVVPGPSSLVGVSVVLDASLPAGAVLRLHWVRGADPSSYVFEVDTDADGLVDDVLVPTITTIVDAPPAIIGVHQWGKGTIPTDIIESSKGDPLGRLVAVLFSERVSEAEAVLRTSYAMPEHRVSQAILQPDERLVFLMLDKPVGPLVERALTVTGLLDERGNVMPQTTRAVVPDPELGAGGSVSGTVRAPDGTPVPFAAIDYVQWVKCISPLGCNGGGDHMQMVVSRVVADMDGQYSLDFVLKNDFMAGFRLEAMEPETGHPGKVATEIGYDGQRLRLDIIIRGYGSIVGYLRDEDGNPVPGADPGEAGSLSIVAKNLSTGEAAVSWVDATGYYAFPRTLVRPNGSTSSAPQITVGNVLLQVLRASDRATAVTTTNLPAAGAVVHQDLILTPSTRYGTVAGRVLEADGETGAANVRVQIAAPVLVKVELGQRRYKQGVVGSTYTDASGRFFFTDVPTGDIEVYAFRQSTYEQARVKSYLTEGETKSVSLAFPGSGGRVHGLVVDALGAPVANAKVAGGPTLTTADELGFFEISGLPLGTMTVWAQAPDMGGVGKVSVTVDSPTFDGAVVIAIEPMGTISGTVFAADGARRLAGQEVQLWGTLNGQSGVMAATFTRSDGTYLFRNYPLGKFSLRAVTGDYGDGGMADTAIRFAGDIRNADIQMRGLGRVQGRVIQSNGTPVIADLLLRRNVWRVYREAGSGVPNYYLDYVDTLMQDEQIGADVEAAFRSGYQPSDRHWFVLANEPTNADGNGSYLRSDILDGNGAVTGRFEFTGSITGGPFSITASNGFLAPATVSSEIPKTTNAEARIVNVGDIVLVPTTGSIAGTVFMPDGVTPVGEGVAVRVRVTTSRVPEITVTTDEDGTYSMPLVVVGRASLVADTGAPTTPALSAAEMNTQDFELLNVRIYGSQSVSVPPGDTVFADIRLLDAAGVRVQVVQNDGVTVVPGARVNFATTSSLDAELDRSTIVNNIPGYRNQFADTNGILPVFPVIEGSFSVCARHPTLPATGCVDGKVPRDPANGLELPVTVRLGAVTTNDGQVVQAPSFGTVTGTVLHADGTPLSTPAEINVTASGSHLATTSDETGHFLVESVPAGSFKVEAFEPMTARTGSVTGSVAGDAVRDVTVKLVGLGTVAGQVFSADGLETIPAVQVVLEPTGNFTAPLITVTDLVGGFLLPGVPLGSYRIVATDYETHLSGVATGTMVADGDSNTTNVFMEGSGRIRGVVYAAGAVLNADGTAPPGAPTVAGASVVMKKTGFSRTVQTDANGAFDSGDYMRLGAYGITVRPPAGYDGATASTVLSYDGEEARLSIVLRGSGTVNGVVLDSLGEQPIPQAQVTLTSKSGFAGGQRMILTSNAGEFAFADVPVGQFSVSVRTTLQTPQLGATATGTIAASGDVIAFRDDDADTDNNAIWLQASGDIQGVVLLPDGTTPAANAVVTATYGSKHIARVCDASGAFLFEALPLTSYRLDIVEESTNAIARRTHTLTANGEVKDFGSIILDNTQPTVVSMSPAPGSTDVPPRTGSAATPIIIVLSERMDVSSSSVSSSTVLVTRAGIRVNGSFFVEDDPGVSPPRSRIRFVPSTVWPDVTAIQVRVKGELRDFENNLQSIGPYDLAGWGLPEDFVATFTTADSTPPSILSRSPAPGALEVPAEAVVRVELNEPVNPASLGGLTLTCNGAAIGGTVAWPASYADRVLVMAPSQYLLPNQDCTAVLSGPLADLSGNAMAQASISWGFRTVDTVPPNVVDIVVPSTASLETGTSVHLTTLVDAADVKEVELSVDGVIAAVPTVAPYAYDLLLTKAPGSVVTVGARAVDLVGNRGPLSTKRLTTRENVPPVVSITSPADGVRVGQGSYTPVVVSATDSTGISRMTLVANNGSAGTQTYNFTAPTQNAGHTFTWTMPMLPYNAAVVLQVSALDALGAVSTSNQVTAYAEDLSIPSVSIVSPAAATWYEPGATVTVSVRGQDTSGIKELKLVVSGAVVMEQSQPIDPPASPVVRNFTFQVPANADGHSSIYVKPTAIDVPGNSGSTEKVTLRVRDRVPPVVVSSTPSNVATNVSPAIAELSMTFNEDVRLATIDRTTWQILGPDGAAVPGTILSSSDPSATGCAARFQPDPTQLLRFGATYTMTATAGIRDLASNSVVPFTSNFTVAPFTLTSPSAAARLIEGEMMTLGAAAGLTSGITSVQFVFNDAVIATDTAAPYAATVATPAHESAPGEVYAELPVVARAYYGSTRFQDSVPVVIRAYPASGDADSDGMTNGEELAAGTLPYEADANADPDGDCLVNALEIARHTDVHDADSDADGLSDGVEVGCDGLSGEGTDPLLADTDGDGIRDALEIQTGSDPVDDQSVNLALALSGIESVPPTFSVKLASLGDTGQVQLQIIGHLLDDTTIDLTSGRGTTYATDNAAACAVDASGLVTLVGNGTCVLTAVNATHEVEVVGRVISFTPRVVAAVPITPPSGSAFANNVDVAGGYAYVAAGAAGLSVISLSDRWAPQIVSWYTTGGNANDVTVPPCTPERCATGVTALAYVAAGSAGLKIVDVSNPLAPANGGTYTFTGADVRDVVVRGTLAFLATGTGGLRIVDVAASLPSPQLRGSRSISVAKGLDVNSDGSIAVVAAGSAGLALVDVTTPTSPQLLKTVSLGSGGDARDVALSGDGHIAYVADYSLGLVLVDITDPQNPPAPVRVAGTLADVVLGGDDLLLGADASFTNTVSVYQVSTAMAPIIQPQIQIAARYRAEYGTGIAADDRFVYVTGARTNSENGTGGDSRLYIAQYRELDSDGDGMSDTLEERLGLDKLVATNFDSTDVVVTNKTIEADERVHVRSLTLENNAKLTHPFATTTYSSRLEIDVGTLAIDSTSSIDVAELGYLGARRAGNSGPNGLTVGNVATTNGDASGGAGGSYGGRGGPGGNAGTTMNNKVNAPYGALSPPDPHDYTNPSELGTGGGACEGCSDKGGHGGGLVRITADTLTLNGHIHADGMAGSSAKGGGGSGGGIRINANNITCGSTALITARGGAADAAGTAGGGGGGRIAIYGDASSCAGKIFAGGGAGNDPLGAHKYNGAPGTILLRLPTEEHGALILDSEGNRPYYAQDYTNEGSILTLENLVVRGVLLKVGTTAIQAGEVRVEANGGIVPGYAATAIVPAVRIEAATVIVSNSQLDATGAGYLGGKTGTNTSYNGVTFGNVLTSNGNSTTLGATGGSYGGLGGAGTGNLTANSLYGAADYPNEAGTGGGAAQGQSGMGGGGGGVIVVIAESLELNSAAIVADGSAPTGAWAGGGSGGAIRLQLGSLIGNGAIHANGSSAIGTTPYGGGGGGGRVLVQFGDASQFTGTIVATGGTGYQSQSGGSGTVVCTDLEGSVCTCP